MTLADLLLGVERRQFPPADGTITVLPAPPEGASAVVSFTGCVIVAADVDPGWVRERLPHGELSEAFTPPFLGALATLTGRKVNSIDMLALAPPGAPAAGLSLAASDEDHSRVRRARRYRTDVRVWSTEGGVLTLGRGLAGRWEIGIEVVDTYRGKGLGRRLAEAARGLVPSGRPALLPGQAPAAGNPGADRARERGERARVPRRWLPAGRCGGPAGQDRMTTTMMSRAGVGSSLR